MAPHPIGTPPPYQARYEGSTTTRATSSPTLARRPLLPGVYAPTPCFFLPNEDLDLVSIASHAVRLAEAGLVGLAVQGSNGEAVHLSSAERNIVTRTTRQALDAAGYETTPVIVGSGAQSTRETISLCRDAADAGGDYALILPPSYFAAAYDRQDILEFFRHVADASPLPVLIYNFPKATAGLDLDSDLLIALSQHPNIIGAKLTCGNVGKLSRLVTASAPSSTLAPKDHSKQNRARHGHPSPPLTPTSLQRRSLPNGPSPSSKSHLCSPTFMCLAGSADFFLPALIAGAQGTLAGLANIAPKTCVALHHAYQQGDLAMAHATQAVLARADWTAVQQGGIVGVKAALRIGYGYGGEARQPLPRWDAARLERLQQDLKEVLDLEASL